MAHNDPAEPPWEKANEYDWDAWRTLTLRIRV